MFVKILPSINNLFPLVYKTGLNVDVYDVVLIPFRSKEILGLVISKIKDDDFQNLNIDENKVRYVIKKFDLRLRKENLCLIERVSKYYSCPESSVLKLILPIDKIEKYDAAEIDQNERNTRPTPNMPILSQEQQNCMHELMNSKKPSLLYGVTGSGKTEVYFHLINETLKTSDQVLILIPEIGLISQMRERFKNVFGFEPLIWHSGLNKSKRNKAFHEIINSHKKVIMGARSALFLPYKNLKLIVVDEEHDASYKQNSVINYNARDCAVLVANIFDAKVLLTSATPSIETYKNCIDNKYFISILKSRFMNAQMPQIHVINMLKEIRENKILSSQVSNVIRDCISAKQQVLIFLNRKGYANMLLCSNCGCRVCCKNCSVYMVLHKSKKRLECHHCGYVASIKKDCKTCESQDSMITYGVGVEKIEEEISENFKDAVILTLTSDEMNNQEKASNNISKIINNKVDIIIGTSVISKGYNFYGLNTVIVIDSDASISPCDIRIMEKNFQILSQISGRAGREKSQTRANVYLQTHNPNSKILKYLCEHNLEMFLNEELNTRKSYNLPPFSKLISIIISSNYEKALIDFTTEFGKNLPKMPNLSVLGPVKSTIYKINRKYRYRFLFISEKQFDFKSYFEKYTAKLKIPSQISLKIDVDPYSFH